LYVLLFAFTSFMDQISYSYYIQSISACLVMYCRYTRLYLHSQLWQQ